MTKQIWPQQFNIGDTVKFRGFIATIIAIKIINGIFHAYIDTSGKRSYAVIEFDKLTKV